jgi:prolyl-tRNA editing enzyme YbaK/EbsC (Cys-tRNA(Pro) deacylase)
MTSDLSESARRVQTYLQERGFAFEVQESAGSTRTAQDAAARVGCDVGQIAKSLVFKEKQSGRLILVIASGANRVDVKKIEKHTGMKLGMVDGASVKAQVGFAVGGVPPAGHNEPLETLLDPDLKKHEAIWAAAGTPNAVFRLKPEELASLTDGRWIDLAQ